MFHIVYAFLSARIKDMCHQSNLCGTEEGTQVIPHAR